MSRSASDRTRARRTLALGICALVSVGAADAAGRAAPAAHLAIDGMSLSLDDVAAASVTDGVDALGVRVRAGIEFGGWRAHRLAHRSERERSRRSGHRHDSHRGRAANVPYRGPRLGVEMHAAVAHGERETSLEDVDTTLLGGYLTGRIPLGSQLSVKGLVGLTSLRTDREFDAFTSSERLTGVGFGVGFGVGAEAAIGRYTDLTVDWMRYLADERSDGGIEERASALAVGVKFRF